MIHIIFNANIVDWFFDISGNNYKDGAELI